MNKWWKFGTGIEILGTVLLVVIIIPTILAWVIAEIEDAAHEEMIAHEQRTLLEELSDKVETLQMEQVTK